MGKFKSMLRRYSLSLVSAVVFAILMALILFIFLPLRKNAEEIGEGVGASTGKLTGYAVGSYHGLTEGRTAGFEAGRTQGLKAEDTEAEIANAIEDAGALEVLAASVTIMNPSKVGDSYAALYLVFGDAVFTVDLKQADISQKDDGSIVVAVPEPQVELYINDDKTEKIAESISNRYAGSTKAGYEAFMNSMDQINEKAEESISGYDTLLEQARQAAIKQVKLLAGNVCGSGKTITVDFK